MSLTSVQKAALKDNIAANTVVIGGIQIKDMPLTTDANYAIAEWYNGAASPDFFVYRTSVSIDEIMSNGFEWDRVDNATIGKARIWEWMANVGSMNPSKSNIIVGINAAWSGGANDAHRASIFTHCQKLASNVEKLLAISGAGTSISNLGVGPAIPGFVGSVTADEIEEVRQAS